MVASFIGRHAAVQWIGAECTRGWVTYEAYVACVSRMSHPTLRNIVAKRARERCGKVLCGNYNENYRKSEILMETVVFGWAVVVLVEGTAGPCRSATSQLFFRYRRRL